jgi:hypothetical protein
MAITDLTASPTGSTSARLQWSDIAGASNYTVMRGLNSTFSAAVSLAAVAPGVKVYNDYSLAPDTVYWYWVVAAGSPSNPDSIQTYKAPITGSTWVQLQDALYAWVTAVLGAVPVAWAGQGETKQIKPFVILTLVGPTKVPALDHLQDHNESLGGNRTYRVTVAAYTDPISSTGTALDAAQYIATLMTSLDSDVISDALYAAGIGVGEIYPSNDVSELLETKYERRVQFDFEINVASNYPVTTPVIDTVQDPVGSFA